MSPFTTPQAYKVPEHNEIINPKATIDKVNNFMLARPVDITFKRVDYYKNGTLMTVGGCHE